MTKTNPLSVKNIKDIARIVREDNKISNDEAFPIFNYLEELFSKGDLSIQILEDDDPYLDEQTIAVYNCFDNFIYIKDSAIKELEEGNPRNNFTLAHELFHYMQANVLDFSFEEVEECKTYEDVDWQANEFAGELLVPDEALMLEAEDISSIYNVSIECALTRKMKQKKRNSKK